jgi:hypothetical protein
MASILLCCTDEVQIQISEYTSALLAWQALDQTYNRSGFIATYVLLKQFFSSSLLRFIAGLVSLTIEVSYFISYQQTSP